MKTSIAAIVFILLSAFVFFTGCNKPQNNTEKQKSDTTKTVTRTQSDAGMDMMTSMSSMMKDMKSVKMTGDYDIDFASMMIEHHKGAIEMAEIELKSGKDEKLRAMANTIISKQKEEISKLEDFVKTNKPVASGKMDLMSSMKEMNDMMMNMKMYNDPDKDFASMMILHHQGAIMMQEKEIANGKNQEIKKMSKESMNDQKKEITEFQAWLNSKK
ncbi:MAG: DUF305 domain-containing protein [Ignavibacteria bacterium]|jgi:uncharacterized protein (DUF305 family)|nr:DUF305 domain-containing protein [Ignavibacteria bacterium]